MDNTTTIAKASGAGGLDNSPAIIVVILIPILALCSIACWFVDRWYRNWSALRAAKAHQELPQDRVPLSAPDMDLDLDLISEPEPEARPDPVLVDALAAEKEEKMLEIEQID